MNAYLTVEDAQDYFDERLNTDAWDDASDADKLKALKMATRAIEALNFVGEKTVDSQEFQFPRGGDTAIPSEILEACCELALRLLDGVDLDSEHDLSTTTDTSFSSVKNTYDRSIALEHVVAGIPSIQAWNRLVPYLRDAKELSVVRAT